MEAAWYLLYPLLVLAPLALTVLLGGYDSRLTQARWLKFVELLNAGGFTVRSGSKPGQWSAEGLWDGHRFSVEVFQIRQGKSTVSRTGFRLLQPTTAFDAVVYPAADVRLDELGTMQEVPMDAAFGGRYRVFGQASEQVQQWLGPACRAMLLELQALKLEIKGGAMMLVLPSGLREAFDVLRAVELLSAIHDRREPRRDALGAPVRLGWSSPWTVVLAVPLIVGFIGAFVLPMVPGVAGLAAPLVCEQGELKMVWSSSGSGRSSGNLYCVQRTTREGVFLRPLLLAFNVVFWTLTAGLSLRAALKKPEPTGERTLAPLAPTAYRQP